ncbi:MAG: nitrous oxide reductase family maturation protein NosD [Alphaproteobacteria bacterium]|nr:nitrous oxide reductase family maturation protein NosD [Alphaproteobacteria bacterium]
MIRFLFAACLLAPWAAAATPLQPLIDAVPVGGRLGLAAGIYEGPAIITQPLSLEGGPGVIVDGGGKGSVIVIKTNGATVQGLTIRNSGTLHDTVDSGIQVRGRGNVVKDNVIENCLFGIDLQQSDTNVVRRNTITSQDIDLGVRGDAIRLWYSNRNRVQDNVVTDSRDVVVWYSHENEISGNDVRNGRYGLHFMYSHHNVIENNHFLRNTVGVFMMFSNDLVIRGNRVVESNGPSGLGIGLKETSGTIIEGNDIVGNATGLYLDISPYDPDSGNEVKGNRFAFNGMAILFHSDWEGNAITGNDFIGNFGQVMVRGGGTAKRQGWAGNYWDVYEGFDRDRDGTGDTAFELFSYADRLWMDVPQASFFRTSPALEVIDFLERLAPFSPPLLLLRDEKPATRRVAG